MQDLVANPGSQTKLASSTQAEYFAGVHLVAQMGSPGKTSSPQVPYLRGSSIALRRYLDVVAPMNTDSLILTWSLP